MALRFVLADHLAHQLVAEAKAASPRECCGLIEGRWQGAVATATALHPTINRASAADRFAIDPAEHIALLRRLRGSGQTVIGCYHSHPNGLAAPSAHDRDGAAEENFIWLIQPVQAGASSPPAAFFFQNERFTAMPVSNSA